MKVRIPDRAAHLVAALALVAYVPGFWWGVPAATAADRVQAWGVDDSAPLGPLAEMYNLVSAQPDRNLGYPLLHDILAAAAYTPYLVSLRATGQLQGMSTVYPFGFSDPVGALRVLTLLNHALSVLFGVIVVVATYDAARTLWGPATGVASAAFALTLYPMFYYARTGNVDVPTLAFVALALAALARGLVHGMTARRAVWIGVFGGLALATKESAVGALVPAGFAVVLFGRRQGGWRVPALAFAAAVTAFGAGSGLLVDPQRYLDHVRFITGRIHDLPYTPSLPSAYPLTAAGHSALAAVIGVRLVDALTAPGLLLAFVGAIAASRRERRAALVALAIPSYIVMEFFLLRAALLRYVIPAAFVLALFAGWALVTAWSARGVLRVAATTLAAAALGLQVAYGASLTYEMVRDSRYDAGTWLAQRLHTGDRVDYFGAPQKLPPLPAGVVSLPATRFRGMWQTHPTDTTTTRVILHAMATRRPAFVVIAPDYSSRDNAPYDASVPPSLYDSLVAGVSGFQLVALFRTPPLLAWLPRPPLDYPAVNPPIRVFAPAPTAR